MTTTQDEPHEQPGSASSLPAALQHLPELRRHVTRSANEWPAPRVLPTAYPGTAPDGHYLLIGDRVLPLEAQADGSSLEVRLPDGPPLDEVLARLGSAPLAERVPVLAYGANRSPQTMVVKFSHHRLHEQIGPTAAVPVLAVTVGDVDIVGAGISSQGCIYADMTPSPGTRASVKLTLLDRDQAEAIHHSEGVGQGMYDCALLPDVQVVGTPLRLSVVAYAGCVPVFVSPATGTPVAFSAIAADDRRFAAYGQQEMFAHVLEAAGLVAAVAGLLGGPDLAGHDPLAVAKESARLLSGQWWYTHNTGDTAMAAARQVQRLIEEGLRRHSAADSTSQRLTAAGQVLDTEVAYASGPELRLGAQLALA